MKKVFSKIGHLSKKAKVLVVSALAIVCVMSLSIVSFATDGEETVTATQSISSVMTSSFQTMVTDLVTTLSGLLPVALSIVSVGLVISYGIKWFKKISGKA